MTEGQAGAAAARHRIRDPQRTRAVIVQALLDCVREGETPTARRLAERAGVSERSIFVHFRDLDDLRAAAAETQHEAIVSCLEPIDADMSLRQRVEALVTQREKAFALQSARLIGRIEARRSTAIAASIARTDAVLTEQVREVFAPELRKRPRVARRELLGLLDATVGWAFRYHLTTTSGWSASTSSKAISAALLTLLADPGERPDAADRKP